MRFSHLPVGQKLQWAGLAATFIALLAASAAFVAYDVLTFRDQIVKQIRTDAHIIGLNSVSTLLFEDPETARSTLSALSAEPQVETAAIYAKDGRLFTSYRHPDTTLDDTPVPDPSAPARFRDGSLVVTHPIVFEGQSIGSVVIRAHLRQLRQRVWRYLGIAALVLAGSLGMATLIARRLNESISAPIRDLARTAAVVSAGKDYSVRAAPGGHDEIGFLIATFNEMLAQIQAQDEALRQSQALLERRVEERTAELAAANKELEAFSYSVSHDLRAPLRGIDGFSRVLLEEYAGKPLDDQGRHYLQRVRVNTQRMAELIDDLLHLSRVTRADLVRRPVDVTAVAQKIAAELTAREPDRKITFGIAEGMKASADAHLLTIVLENLMGNAWKFTGRRPVACVEVGLERGGDGETVFFVRDNGAGFDMEYATHLFGVFQRLHEAQAFEGTGIGLATVQRIVHRHGGRIWAESAPDKGATFRFTLGGEA